MTLNTKTSWELLKYVWKLEEENRKLKEMCDVYVPRALRLEQENKKLKEEFEQYKKHYNIEKDKQHIFLMTWRRY